MIHCLCLIFLIQLQDYKHLCLLVVNCKVDNYRVTNNPKNYLPRILYWECDDDELSTLDDGWLINKKTTNHDSYGQEGHLCG